MTIIFNNAIGLTNDQIKQTESAIGKALPVDLKEYLQKNSNATPTINDKPCCFEIVHSDGWTTSAFIESIPSFPSLKNHLDNKDSLAEYAEHFKLSRDFVETEYLFPIANTSNGALYVSLDGQHRDKIYSVDNGDFGIIFQSNNLKDFWNSVYEDS